MTLPKWIFRNDTHFVTSSALQRKFVLMIFYIFYVFSSPVWLTTIRLYLPIADKVVFDGAACDSGRFPL